MFTVRVSCVKLHATHLYLQNTRNIATFGKRVAAYHPKCNFHSKGKRMQPVSKTENILFNSHDIWAIFHQSFLSLSFDESNDKNDAIPMTLILIKLPVCIDFSQIAITWHCTFALMMYIVPILNICISFHLLIPVFLNKNSRYTSCYIVKYSVEGKGRISSHRENSVDTTT